MTIRTVTPLGLAISSLFFLLPAPAVQAAGTPAGTDISNQVTLGYTDEGVATTTSSNIATFTVAEIIDVSLIAQDAAPVIVNSPDTNRPLTVLLTNIGNGSENFSLVRNNLLPGDQFDPVTAASGGIFLESGAQPGFQASGPNADALYIEGINNPVLAADASLVVYLVSDIPNSLGLGSTGQSSLSVESRTAGAAGAAPGTILNGLGAGGVDALVGATGATASTTGSYQIGGLAVSVSKSVTFIQDPQGRTGNAAIIMPGTVLTYSVIVNVIGNGTANNLAFNDPLPAETSFVPNSITVNGAPRTDAIDADGADFTANTINVIFGNTISPATHAIEFRVTVN
ncbi:MAG: DUF11 domain-containing protein [Candidatus Nitrotoga sp.]